MTAPRSSSNAAAQQQPEFQYRIPVFSLLLAGPPTSPGGIVLHHSLVGWPSFTFIDMSKDVRSTLMQARSAVEGSVLLFTCSDQRQAAVLGVVIQVCQGLIRGGTMRVLGQIRSQDPVQERAIQKILTMAGLNVFDDVARLTPKAAEFKLRQLAVIARYNAQEGERRSKTILDEVVDVPIQLRASLPGDVDYWSMIVSGGVQKRRGLFTWGMIGPPPACGRWVRQEEKTEANVQHWRWIPHRVPEWLTQVDSDLFYKEKGSWVFQGHCPQYNPTGGSWSFSSPAPLLSFQGEDKSSRIKIQDSGSSFFVAHDGPQMPHYLHVIQQLIMGPMGFERGAAAGPVGKPGNFVAPGNPATRGELRPPHPLRAILPEQGPEIGGKSDLPQPPTMEQFAEATNAVGNEVYEALFEDVQTSITVLREGAELRGKVLDLFEDEISLELANVGFSKGDRTWIRFTAPGRNGGSPVELLVMAEVRNLTTLDGGLVSTEFRLDGVDREIMREFVDIYLERQKAVVDFLYKARGVTA